MSNIGWLFLTRFSPAWIVLLCVSFFNHYEIERSGVLGTLEKGLGGEDCKGPGWYTVTMPKSKVFKSQIEDLQEPEGDKTKSFYLC